MSASNKIVIAAAGSGKTTHLVREALRIADETVLIATYTESNEAEIKRKILDLNGHIPANIFVTTWFAFLIAHGIRPFQGALFEFDVRGMILTETQSGFRYTSHGRPIYWGEKDFTKYYFDAHGRVYSDKLSKLVIRCNEASAGSVFDRISRIYRHIFVDEVQDLAGYDLDILSQFFCCDSNVLIVGDPRQVTYQTHHERRHTKYSGGKFLEFFKEELPKGTIYEVDETTLNASHRNSSAICAVSSKLFPTLKPTESCTCEECRAMILADAGLFIVRRENLPKYLQALRPTQLRYSAATKGVDPEFHVLNFGEAKGLGFDRVLIFPTADMVNWMKNNAHAMKDQTRAKLYVALTRARHSVAIAHDFEIGEVIDGFDIYG